MTAAARPCDQCGSIEVAFKPMEFSNGSSHIKKVCGQCGKFRGFEKQSANSFKEELFMLVKDMATADQSQFVVLKKRADRLMKMAGQ